MTSTATTIMGAYPSTQPNRYKSNAFSRCEKCDAELTVDYWSTNDTLYYCRSCGFDKSYTHVSFGFPLKIPNYWSLTRTHSADDLHFANGDSLRSRILIGSLNKGVIAPTLSVARKKWEMWVNENTMEIVKLAVLADNYNLGADPKIEPAFDPIIHLLKYVKERQGIYLTLVNLKNINNRKKGQKIGHAIDYALKRSDVLIWLGGTHDNHPSARILISATTRLNKYHAEFYGYLDYDKYKKHAKFDSVEERQIPKPIYITGPSMFECKKHGFTQESLDKYVDKFMTTFNNSLNENNKIKILVNTGNSGIDTSVIRWAVKNKIYVVVINLSQYMYQNENGHNSFENGDMTLRRLLKRPMPEVETNVVTIDRIDL